jgi:protease I
MTLLSDLKVAVLVEHGVDQAELGRSREVLEKAGITVEVVSPHIGEVKAWDDSAWGIRVKVDQHIADVDADNYDGLLLPGGIFHTDELRINPFAVDFVKHFFAAGKPVAAIGHAVHILINANIIEGRQVTSSPSIRCDLIGAGALWVDQDVVSDNGLITSRYPQDIEAFTKKFLEELREGVHQSTETII